MKKQIWIPLLIFSILLSACSFGFEEEKEPRERLDVSAWPTPVSPTPTVQPTPFPMTTLAPTTVSVSRTEVEEVAATPEAGVEIAQLIPGGVTTELIQQVSNLTGGLTPVAVFNVSDDEVGMRQGPGTNYGTSSTIEKGELGGILGQDSSGEWVFVLTIDKQQGWLPLTSIRVVGTLDEAPILPPDPIGALMQQAQAALTGGAASGSNGSTSTSSPPLDFAGLQPVASASITSDLINLRQRPGPNYKLLGSLAGNTPVEVYGLNRDGEWALIKTGDGQFAWASMDYLDVDGSLAQAPQFRTLEPGAGHPANQAAPMIDATGAPVAVAAVQTNGSSQNTIPAAATNTSSDGLPGNTLAPKGSATVNIKTDMLTGPAANFGPVDTLTIDQPVTILATNEFGDWVLVQTDYSNIGWVPLDTLTVDGPSPGVSPVLTARITSNELSLLSGPAIFYDEVGVAAINTVVSVIGLNEGKSWALIETTGGNRGWIQLRLLEVYGTLDGVPTASTPPLADNTPTEQLPAPVGPPKGKLVIQTSSGGDVVSINADGSNLNVVTTGIDPVLSPDGQQIAFTRWGNGDVGSLYVANADGSGERVVLSEMRKAKGPDWSPDGSQIILNFQQGGRVEEKRSCNEGAGRPPLGAFNIKVEISDKGEIRLCYTLPADPHWSLRLIDVADGNYADKYGGLYAFRPTFDVARPWRVVSGAGNGLLATDINRDDYRQQVTDIAGDGSPAFSPDGRYIAVTTESNGVRNIYRMNADGGNRVKLTDTPLWVPVQPSSNQKQWNHVAPVWSPDGSRIAFLTDRNGQWEVWVMNADGSNPQPMFSDEVNEQLNINYNFVDERVLDWQ